MTSQTATRPVVSRTALRPTIADRIAELIYQAEEIDRISRLAHDRIAYELDTLTARN